jgi:hypothetical protein
MSFTEPTGFFIDGGWATPSTLQRIDIIEASESKDATQA